MELVSIYDKLYLGGGYDDYHITDNEGKWAVISKLLSDINFNSVVDLGCGRGFYLRKLLELGKDAIGVEFSKVCCEKYLNDVPYINEDIFSFCRQDRCYDLTLCMDVLEHIEPSNISELIQGIRNISERAIIGVANHSDVLMGHELHLIIENHDWWYDKLKKYYNKVETFIFSERFYFFNCK